MRSTNPQLNTLPGGNHMRFVQIETEVDVSQDLKEGILLVTATSGGKFDTGYGVDWGSSLSYFNERVAPDGLVLTESTLTFHLLKWHGQHNFILQLQAQGDASIEAHGAVVVTKFRVF